MADSICAVDGCDRDARTKGMCQTHYVRTRRGTPLDQPLRPYAPGSVCTIEGCDRPNAGKGHCKMHGKRRQKYGDPNYVHPRPNNWKPMPGELNPNWRGDDLASYYGAHHRVESVRGRAQQCDCTHCGKPAQQWAYDHLDPAEKLGGPTGRLRYSVEPDHYIPLCLPCHMRFDRKGT